MINFTNCKELLNTYGGSEKKKKMIYNDEIYLVKFPDPVRQQKNPLSYMNNQYSEHIGCQIFKSIGINAQDTLLGTYIDNKKTKVVVACKDFTDQDHQLVEFSKLINSMTDSKRKFKATIEDVYKIINDHDLITHKNMIINQFWDMFVVDALLGNSDRHLDNWGLIQTEDSVEFAPVYDCGSSLNPLIEDIDMEVLLNNEVDLKNISYNVRSAYKMNNQTIMYSEIFKNPPEDLKNAILRIVPKIEIDKIHDIIRKTEGMTDIHKEFIIKTISIRNDLIIQPAYKRILKKTHTLSIKKQTKRAKELLKQNRQKKDISKKKNISR